MDGRNRAKSSRETAKRRARMVKLAGRSLGFSDGETGLLVPHGPADLAALLIVAAHDAGHVRPSADRGRFRGERECACLPEVDERVIVDERAGARLP